MIQSCKLVALILGSSYVKDPRVTKIVKQIKSEKGWGELEARNCFQRQSFTKYLRQSLPFIWNSKLRKHSISVFHETFTSTEKIFTSRGGLSTRQ